MRVKDESDTDMLARLMAEGFRSMDRRFDSLEGRMDRLEGRTEALEFHVREIHQRLDTLVIPTLDDHSRRIKDLEIAR